MADEHRVPKVLAKYRNQQTSGAAICSESEFQTKFHAFTGGLLGGAFDWSGVFVAGGAVLACLQPTKVSAPVMKNQDPFLDSDIDLFIYGIRSHDEATARVKRVYDDICANLSATAGSATAKPLVIRTARTITVLLKCAAMCSNVHFFF